MTNSAVGTIGFLVGAAIGSVVTWKAVKDKYEKMAEEEIDSMRAYYQKKKHPEKKRAVKKEEKPEKPEQPRVDEAMARRAEERAIQAGYIHYSSVDRRANTEEKAFEDVPYLIDEETFDNDDFNTKIEWTYYADDILTDENEDIISTQEIEDSIGMESLGHFGKANAIYVRNDRLKAIYMICKDKRNYADVYGEA